MSGFERYAIYYCPRPDTELAEFGKAWLGTEERLYPSIPESLLAQPRRYGFHATLKAPFRLANGYTEEALVVAVEEFAAAARSVSLSGVILKSIGHFFALVPATDSEAVRSLAFNCVSEFDGFRAPLNEGEISRRMSANLTPRQEQLLYTWGYPYVAEEFRFHLTLTGPLSAPERLRTQNVLQDAVVPFADQPIMIEDLCICGDPGNNSPFELIKRIPLSG